MAKVEKEIVTDADIPSADKGPFDGQDKTRKATEVQKIATQMADTATHNLPEEDKAIVTQNITEAAKMVADNINAEPMTSSALPAIRNGVCEYCGMGPNGDRSICKHYSLQELDAGSRIY